MKENLILICSIEEYHYFIKFNAFINELKKLNLYEEIIAVVPETAIYIISETNKILSITNKFLTDNNANYPEILELQTDRDVLNFTEIAFSYIKEHFDLTKYDVLKHTEYKIIDILNPSKEKINFLFNELLEKINHQIEKTEKEKQINDLLNKTKNEILDIIKPQQSYDWYNVDNLRSSFIRDWGYLSNLMQEGKLLKPTETIYNQIKDKYGFKNTAKTFLLLSRNFKNKHSYDNTDKQLPCVKELILQCLNNNINFINIGFPVLPLGILYTNYREINEKLTHEELLSIFYLSDGILNSGICGSYCMNLCSNIDVFTFTKEWRFEDNSLLSLNEKRREFLSNKVLTKDIIYDENNKNYVIDTFNILNNHVPVYKKEFAQPKEITFIK
jgi:hypothetical protein